MCQVRGYVAVDNAPFVVSSRVDNNTFANCGNFCRSTAGCRSFSIEIATGGKCRLYKKPLSDGFTSDLGNTNLFWDVLCPDQMQDAVCA